MGGGGGGNPSTNTQQAQAAQAEADRQKKEQEAKAAAEAKAAEDAQAAALAKQNAYTAARNNAYNSRQTIFSPGDGTLGGGSKMKSTQANKISIGLSSDSLYGNNTKSQQSQRLSLINIGQNVINETLGGTNSLGG